MALKCANVGDDLGIKSVQPGRAMGPIAEGLIGFVDNFEPKDFFAKVAQILPLVRFEKIFTFRFFNGFKVLTFLTS